MRIISNKMKKKTLFIYLMIFTHCCLGQVQTILDSLDDPIALTIVDDNMYTVLHGSHYKTGKLIKSNLQTSDISHEVLIDSLVYPRAIIERNGKLYIGTRDAIIIYDLEKNADSYDTLIHEKYLFPRSFFFQDDDLLFANEGALSKINVANSWKNKKDLCFFVENPLSIAVSNENVYLAVSNSIYKFNMETRETEEVISDLPYKPYSLLLKDRFLYMDQGVSSEQNDRIIAYNLDNIELGMELFCETNNSVIGMTEYNEIIYFANQIPKFDGKPEGTIKAVNKELLQQSSHSIEIYPNPTKSNFFIDYLFYNETDFELIDTNGRLLKEESNIKEFNLENYPSGTYFLKYHNVVRGLQGYKKIIKVN